MIIKSKRTFVLGDIHGRYDRLIQVLKSSEFDYEYDKLIQLGDVCDRGNDSYKVVEELLKIKNLVAIRGNHDVWFYDFVRTGLPDSNWFNYGGTDTIDSYVDGLKYEGPIGLLPQHVPDTHKQFFANQKPYYIDDQNRMFVHGGFDRTKNVSSMSGEDIYLFWWDRTLLLAALSHKGKSRFKIKDEFKEVYIGHTPTIKWKQYKPMYAANNVVINVDTGSGYEEGKLTLMNIDTKEIFQSTI